MTAQELVEYLKQVAELEASVYCQQKVIAEARKHLQLYIPHKRTIDQPVDGTQKLIIPVKPHQNDLTTSSNWLLGLGLFFVIIGFVLLLAESALGFLELILGIGGLFLGIKMKNSMKESIAQNEEKYINDMREYSLRFEQEKEEYRRKMSLYQTQVERAEEIYQEQKSIAEHNFQQSKKAAIKLQELLNETQLTLEKVYSLEIIFPKYRNMLAMCTIYEYFAAGRCTELVGPNGAYNLFEAELRQNSIINQLEDINANLAQIKQNQYVLYQEITKTNNLLKIVTSKLDSVLTAAHRIADTSAITAHCAEITAMNTSVLKYIALLNR